MRKKKKCGEYSLIKMTKTEKTSGLSSQRRCKRIFKKVFFKSRCIKAGFTLQVLMPESDLFYSA